MILYSNACKYAIVCKILQIHANPLTIQLRNVRLCSIFLGLFEQFCWRILHIKCIEMCLFYFILCQLDVLQFTLGYPQKCNFSIFPLESSLKQQGSMFYRHCQKQRHFPSPEAPPSVRYFCDRIRKNLGISIAQLQRSWHRECLAIFVDTMKTQSIFKCTKTWNLDFENARIHQSQTWVENWWTSYFAPVCVFLL